MTNVLNAPLPLLVQAIWQLPSWLALASPRVHHGDASLDPLGGHRAGARDLGHCGRFLRHRPDVEADALPRRRVAFDLRGYVLLSLVRLVPDSHAAAAAWVDAFELIAQRSKRCAVVVAGPTPLGMASLAACVGW